MGYRNRLEEEAVVDPVHPFERGEFHHFCVPPRATTVDYLGLELAVDGFREGIVIGIADADDGRLDPCFGQALSVVERDVWGGPSHYDGRGHPCVSTTSHSCRQ